MIERNEASEHRRPMAKIYEVTRENSGTDEARPGSPNLTIAIVATLMLTFVFGLVYLSSIF